MTTDVIEVEVQAATVAVEVADATVVPVVEVQGGIEGPPGPPGEWLQMTQAAYDALPAKDPDTLYVIVG